jgi:osmotically-inducible protein OsmY
MPPPIPRLVCLDIAKETSVKTDADLKRDVQAELAWDPSIKASAVGVAVKDGIVTLTGHLDTFVEKMAIERALRRVAGVRAIALELDVKLSPSHKRSDTEIAAAAEHALKWNTMVPADGIRLTVEQGWLRLQGEVEWNYQRDAAAKAVRAIIGVVGLSNEITIKHKPTPDGVARRIEEALTRQAVREAKHVQIGVSGSTVTLRGNVHSWQERDAVAGAAWSAPGVAKVVNDLHVGS